MMFGTQGVALYDGVNMMGVHEFPLFPSPVASCLMSVI